VAAERGGPIERHAAFGRVYHWAVALLMLTLLGTGLLPVAGIKFDWVTIHWLAGLLLTLAVVLHLLRAIFWQGVRSMWIGLRDLRGGRPGKYSLAQKLMHHAWSAVVLAAIVTGLVMMIRIDGPFWQRDPYFLAADSWGLVYVLHGLATLLSVTLVMIHVYFALLPEKRLYLRAMLRGSISREEWIENHDPERWPATGSAEPSR